MKSEAFLIIFIELPLKQMKQFFLEGENPTLTLCILRNKISKSVEALERPANIEIVTSHFSQHFR